MIALDVSPVTARRTGVGTYAEHLALSLSDLGEPLALLTNRPEELPPSLSTLYIASSPRRPSRPTIAWLNLTAPRAAYRSGAVLTHYTTGRAPTAGGPPFVLTVHDLVALEQPDLLPTRERLLVAPFLARSIARAAAIIAVSEDTANAIARRYPALSAPVHVISEGVGDAWFNAPSPEVRAGMVSKLKLGPRVWLYVGAQGRRKNLPRLCEAFALALPRSLGVRPQLVIAGPCNDEDAQLGKSIARLGLIEGQNLIRTDYIQREELHALVAHAELCVFPSLHEGFGLPLAEAMAMGTPCITSGRGALPQVSAGAALIADPLRAEDIAAALLRLGGDEALRASLSAIGVTRARELTWQRCAAATSAVYRQVLSTYRSR